jgi:hypothetical protein
MDDKSFRIIMRNLKFSLVMLCIALFNLILIMVAKVLKALDLWTLF